jgi:hypothetical protein
MNKYFLFKSEQPIPSDQFKELIAAIYREKWSFALLDRYHGYILADGAFYDALTVLLPLFNTDLGLAITAVVAHTLDDLSRQVLESAHRYYRQSCRHMGDVVFDRLLGGDRQILTQVQKQFEDVPRELLLTATAFIESGLNATRASKKLYVHRNTFNYRLQKFIERTNLDIRDYHHAFYFRLSQINL